MAKHVPPGPIGKGTRENYDIVFTKLHTDSTLIVMNSNWRNQVSSVMLTKMIILHHLHVSLVSSFRVPSVSPALVTGRHFTMVAGVSSFTCLKTELKIPEFVPRQVCGGKRLETWTVYWGLLFSTTLPLHRQPACFPRYSGPSAGYAMFVYTGTVEDDIFHISMKSIFLYSCKSWPCKGKSNIIWSWASHTVITLQTMKSV